MGSGHVIREQGCTSNSRNTGRWWYGRERRGAGQGRNAVVIVGGVVWCGAVWELQRERGKLEWAAKVPRAVGWESLR